MRSFLLFTLAVAGLAILTDDASAGIFGRKNKKRGGGGGDCCGAPAPQAPCCGQGQVGYGPQPGYMQGATYGSPYGGSGVGYGPGAGLAGAAGQDMANPNVIQATDGSVYYRGADGSYYANPQGMTGQPYYGGNYPGMYRTRGGYYTPSGVYPAGYPGTPYPGVVPAGGAPLQMPAVPVPMPRR